MCFIICIFLILIVNFEFCVSIGCDSFNEITMLLYDKNGRNFEQGINGCITRTQFINTTVVEAYVKDQKIPKLGRDSVKHMKYLKTVSFNNCELEEILPVAFRNVPSLTKIEIAFGKLKMIPKGIFSFELTPQLEILKIDHHTISAIEDQTFYNMQNLKEVQLNNNRLESFRSEWFENSTFLEALDLSFNKLLDIPGRAFTNFINLQKIDFDHNDITTIHPDAFKGIRILKYLGLSHNKLTVLSEKSFPNTLRINHLKLNANYLTVIPDKVLQKLAAVEISLDFNPWTCPCLDRINYWLYIKNGKIITSDVCNESHIPICVVPKSTEICSDRFDHEAMLRYINTIKTINMSTPIPFYCVTFS